jgi:hypothetical protein
MFDKYDNDSFCFYDYDDHDESDACECSSSDEETQVSSHMSPHTEDIVRTIREAFEEVRAAQTTALDIQHKARDIHEEALNMHRKALMRHKEAVTRQQDEQVIEKYFDYYDAFADSFEDDEDGLAQDAVALNEGTQKMQNSHEISKDLTQSLTKDTDSEKQKLRRYTNISLVGGASFVVLGVWLAGMTGSIIAGSLMSLSIVGIFGFASAHTLSKRKTVKQINAKTPASLNTPELTLAPSALSTSVWEKTVTRYQDIVDRWVNYELDIDKVITYPLMSDLTCEYTAAFHAAYRNAKMHKPSDIPDSDVTTHPFFAAVQELEDAFNKAEYYAQTKKWTGFEDQSQKQLQKAKDLLSLALDDEASLSERQSAYKAARRALEGVVSLPENTISNLEKIVRLEIGS